MQSGDYILPTLKGTVQMVKDDIDKYLGMRLRQRRNTLGLTQKHLGKAAGITFQQVQKYESGKNSMNIRRLSEFSQYLKVPITYFFDRSMLNCPETGKIKASNKLGCSDMVLNKEFFKLMSVFQKIKDPALRKNIIALMSSMIERDKN
jgi:transcriptional regulator with XRE-family HTH domain